MSIKNVIEKLETQGKKNELPKIIKIDKKLSKKIEVNELALFRTQKK